MFRPAPAPDFTLDELCLLATLLRIEIRRRADEPSGVYGLLAAIQSDAMVRGLSSKTAALAQRYAAPAVAPRCPACGCDDDDGDGWHAPLCPYGGCDAG